MYPPKPDDCAGCPLELSGKGYADADGPSSGELVFVGEALGRQEALAGKPFVGPAGAMLARLFKLLKIERGDVKIDNCVRCQPPDDWLDGAPWEQGALQHCMPRHLAQTLTHHQLSRWGEPTPVVALGATATRNLLNLPKERHKQNDWHGCPTQDTHGRWIVPTFHPAFLVRGKFNMIGVVLWDIQRAQGIAQGKWKPEPASLLLDPSIQDFTLWVEKLLVRSDFWLAVDIETDEKQRVSNEDELEGKDSTILRVNLSYNKNEGLTVPWIGPYKEQVKRILATSNSPKLLWNARYDCPRLAAAGAPVEGKVLDFMWAWKRLQSDVPAGLGFVAPFYSNYGAWKHLSGSDFAQYSAVDAVQTYRVAAGITKDLQTRGMWDTFYRYVYELDTKVLHPAERAGIDVDRQELTQFNTRLTTELERLDREIQLLAPTECLPMLPRNGWKRKPKDAPPGLIEVTELAQIRRCMACGKVDVLKTHSCRQAKELGRFLLEESEMEVPRWYVRERFNPSSPIQILEYMKLKGHSPGRSRTTTGPSTGEQTLERLSKVDPFYGKILNYRSIQKVKSTYVDGVDRYLGGDGRLHPIATHRPSTGRLSYTNFNIQNVIGDKDENDGQAHPEAGFRRCLVASSGHTLIEVDFSAIEAVLTGYFCNDKQLQRIAGLGIHGMVVRELHKQPTDLNWEDAKLEALFKAAKRQFPEDYTRAKRTIYGTFYGMTPIGLALTYPKLFSRSEAYKFQELLFQIFPSIPRWHKEMQDLAHRQKFLGGRSHPFGFMHWFWNVYSYNPYKKQWQPGEDSKRVIAFFPQSTAAGILYEVCLRLADDPEFCTQANSPFRALIHDSILCEFPDELVDWAVSRIKEEMNRPIPQLGGLQIGCVAKTGKNWKEMQEWI